MAIEFFTGFEGCASTTDLRAFFDIVNIEYGIVELDATGGFNGSKGFRIAADSNFYTAYVGKQITESTVKAVGFHVRGLPTHGYSGTVTWQFLRLTQTSGAYFCVVNTSSGLKIYNNSGVIVAECGTIISSAETHFEIKIVSHASAGSIQIKVNGSLVLDADGLNTGGDAFSALYWGAIDHNTGSRYYDNLYCADDFQGELYSYLLQPSSDASTQFTPLSGTDNFAMLQSNDGDTSYVESDTIGHKDLYEYEDLPIGLMPPIAASVVMLARKEGTGLREIQGISKQDLVEYNDTDSIALGADYNSTPSPIAAIKNTAPDGTAWTRDKINAIQWGFKVAG